jgi:hypothetical protein
MYPRRNVEYAINLIYALGYVLKEITTTEFNPQGNVFIRIFKNRNQKILK